MTRAKNLLDSIANITEAVRPPYPKNFERMSKDLKSRGVNVSIEFDDHRKCWFLLSSPPYSTSGLQAAGYHEVASYGAFSKWSFDGDDYKIQTERGHYIRIAPESWDPYGRVSTINTGADPV